MDTRDRHGRCPAGQDGRPSCYGVEMHPGRSVWARGVLALGAGILLLSGLLQWRIVGSTDDCGTIQIDGSDALGRSLTKEGANYPTTTHVVDAGRPFGAQPAIGGDERRKRSARLNRIEDGSVIEETNLSWPDATYTVNKDEDAPSDESRERDPQRAIARVDASSTRHFDIPADGLPDVANTGAKSEQARPRDEEDAGRAAINVAAAPTSLRNDGHEEEDTVSETGSRSRSTAHGGRRSWIDVVSRSARLSGSRVAGLDDDNDHPRTAMSDPCRIQLSRSDDNPDGSTRDTPKTTSEPNDRGPTVIRADEGVVRSSDRHRSTIASHDRDSRVAAAIAPIEEDVSTAFSILAEGGIDKPPDGAEGNRSRSSGGASIHARTPSRNATEEDARRYAGMREDRLLFFRRDRERAQSSAMRPAMDRKDRPSGSDVWFARAANRSQNFRGHAGASASRRVDDNDDGGEEILWKKRPARIAASDETKERRRTIVAVDSIFTDREYVDRKDKLADPESIPAKRSGESWGISADDPSNGADNAPRDGSAGEHDKAEPTNAYQILNSVIPPDNKRRKVTRVEESRDLMMTGNFVWTRQDRGHDDVRGVLIPPEHRSHLSRERVRANGGASWRDASSRILRRRRARRHARKRRRVLVGAAGSSPIVVAQIARRVDRRRRHANYYSPRSATPMAYVHIQPYPAAPPTPGRKCVRCMVVYKPCPSQPRPPPRIVLPTYRYREPATKWRGLKYGEYLKRARIQRPSVFVHSAKRFFVKRIVYDKIRHILYNCRARV